MASKPPASRASARPALSVSPSVTPSAPTPAAAQGARVVAGMDSSGDGRDPRAFSFDCLVDMTVTDVGDVYMTDGARVWRLRPGAPVVLAAGGLLEPHWDVDGRLGREVGIVGGLPALFAGSAGEPLLAVGYGRLAGWNADGTLAERWRGGEKEEPAAVIPASGGGAALLTRTRHDGLRSASDWRWWTLPAAGGQAVPLRAASTAEAELLEASHGDGMYIYGAPGGKGVAHAGRLLLRKNDGHVAAIAPDGEPEPTLTTHAIAPDFADDRGRLYRYQADFGELSVIWPGDDLRRFAPLPAGFRIHTLAGAPDGSVYVAGNRPGRLTRHSLVYRLTAEAAEVFAGTDAPALGALRDTPMHPWSLAAGVGDDVYLSDLLQRRVLRVRPGQPLEVVAGAGAGAADAAAPADGAAALNVALDPGPIGRDGQGRIYVVHARREIFRIEDGVLRSLYRMAPAEDPDQETTFGQMVVAPDGHVYVFVNTKVREARFSYVIHLDGAGAQGKIDFGGAEAGAMALAPDGGLGVTTRIDKDDDLVGELRFLRWSPTAGVKEVGRALYGLPTTGLGVVALDDRGRFYVVAGVEGQQDRKRETLRRFDPASGTSELLAGLGASAFGGETFDAGVTEIGSAAVVGADLYFSDGRFLKVLPRIAR